jgi:hypothetical protein
MLIVLSSSNPQKRILPNDRYFVGKLSEEQSISEAVGALRLTNFLLELLAPTSIQAVQPSFRAVEFVADHVGHDDFEIRDEAK